LNIDRTSGGVAAPAHGDPAPPAATTSSSTSLPQPGGLPGSLGVRRSSAPPAPRTTEVLHLTPDVLSIIANKLAQGPRLEAARDVARLAAVDRAFRQAVTTDGQASRRLMDGPPIGKARQLIKDLLSEPQDPDLQAHLCLPVLGLLDRPQQATLVRLLTDHAGRGRYQWPLFFTPFYYIAPHVAELEPALRAELVERAIHCEDDEIAAKAIGVMGRALAHLEDFSIDQLVHKATTLPQPLQRAHAICGLSAGWGHMNDTQRQRLWQETMALQELRGHLGVVTQGFGLGAQLKHLLPDQRTRVFNLVIGLPDTMVGRRALTALAASIEVLEPEQKQTLFTTALGVPTGSRWSLQLVCALVAGMEHMSPVQRTELIGAIQERGPARAVADLGAHPRYVDSQQQHQLLDGAANGSDEDKATVVAGFATGLQEMEPACRRKVGALALGIDGDRSKAMAIGALGPQLKHLDEDQRHAVVEQACRLLGEEVIHPMWGSLDVQRLTSGLGAGLEALRVDQRNALAAAVAAMPLPSIDDLDLATKMQTIAEAVAGLASGQQHLSEAGFAALLQAASRLESLHREFMSKPQTPQEAAAKARAAIATALFGLVRG
jgi:hypothetical protein